MTCTHQQPENGSIRSKRVREKGRESQKKQKRKKGRSRERQRRKGVVERLHLCNGTRLHEPYPPCPRTCTLKGMRCGRVFPACAGTDCCSCLAARLGFLALCPLFSSLAFPSPPCLHCPGLLMAAVSWKVTFTFHSLGVVGA